MSDFPELPVSIPETRAELLRACTTNDRLRAKMMQPFRDGVVTVLERAFATNGHILCSVPFTVEMEDMDFHGEEEWEGWRDEFDSRLRLGPGPDEIDLRPLIEVLSDIPVTDRHRTYTCDQCGAPVDGEMIGQEYVDDSVVHWRDQFWNPKYLALVAGAAKVEDRTSATASVSSDERPQRRPTVLDVGKIRIGVMPMDLDEDWSTYYDFHNVEPGRTIAA